MTKFLNAFVRDESGAAAAEYALILAIVGSGIAVGALYLGSKIELALKGAGEMVCKPDVNAVDLCAKAPAA